MAVLLRFYGISYEVPYPDDHVTVQGAMYYGPAGVQPTGYGLVNLHVWPGFTLVIVLTIFFIFYFLFGMLTGQFENIEAFKQLYLSNPHNFYLIGHVMSALFGVATVLAVYYLARKIFNRKVGLIAALLIAANFIHSFHSQFIRPDIPTTFFAILSILYAVKITENKSLKNYIIAGIFCGLSIATKFTSGVLIVSLLAAHMLSEKRVLIDKNDDLYHKELYFNAVVIIGLLLLLASAVTIYTDMHLRVANILIADVKIDNAIIGFLNKLARLALYGSIFILIIGWLIKYVSSARYIFVKSVINKKLWYGIISVVITFIVFDPVFFLKFKDQMKTFIYTPMFMGGNTVFADAGSMGSLDNLIWYLKGSLSWGGGVHFLILSLFGIIVALLRKKWVDYIVLAFPLLNFIAICLGNLRWERWVLPLMPFMAIYAAFALYKIVEYLKRFNIQGKWSQTIMALLAIAVIIPSTYNIIRYDYMLTHKDTRITAKEWVEANLPKGSKIGRDAYTGDISKSLFDVTRKYTLGDLPYEHYIKSGYQYLIVSDTQYRRYISDEKNFPKNAKFYRTLFKQAILIKTIEPREDLWPPPDIRFPKYHIHFSPKILVYKIS